MITIEAYNTKDALLKTILRELRMGTEPMSIDDWYEEAFDAADEIWKKEQEDQEKQKQVDARNKLREGMRSTLKALQHDPVYAELLGYDIVFMKPEDVDDFFTDDICDNILRLSEQLADKFHTAEPKAEQPKSHEREWKAVRVNLENEGADSDDTIIRKFLLSL